MNTRPHRPFRPPYEFDPDPSWTEHLAGLWDRVPTWAKVFLVAFAGCLVLAVFAGLAVWFFTYGWIIPGVISVCAVFAAVVTLLGALITDGFSL